MNEAPKNTQQIMDEWGIREKQMAMTQEDWDSPDWAIKVVAKLDLMTDEEYHGTADKLICEVLEKLGHQDIVRAYDAVPKWYE